MPDRTLTAQEAYIVRTILLEVNEKLQFDNEHGEYREQGDIILSLTPEDKEALSSVLQKICYL